MNTAPVQVERRVGQRFPYLLPVSFRVAATGVEGVGFTQDLSSRGAFILTGASLHEGDEIELTLTMPSEITLGESMRVRCRGHILRVVIPANRAAKIPDEVLGAVPSPGSVPTPAAEIKIAVAVRLECYEYLTDCTPASTLPRVAVLHPQHEEDGASRIPRQR
jgi:hypothetical protein